MVVGFWNQRFTHMPMALAMGQHKQLNPQGVEWQSVFKLRGNPPRSLGLASIPKSQERKMKR
jgi:6-phosphofructokinase 1